MATAPPVGQSVTGTGIVDQAASIADMAAKNALTARGQDTQTAIANANNATSIQGENIRATAQLQAAYIQAGTEAQRIRAQLYVDEQKNGVDVATLNYNQRIGAVQQQLAYSSQVLQAQGARVDARFKALDLLASRSGPQDWVAYNYLLNQMGAPTGQLVDPTKFADEIKDPAAPAGLGALNQPYTPAAGTPPTIPDPTMPAPVSGGAAPTVAAPAPYGGGGGAPAGGGGGFSGTMPPPPTTAANMYTSPSNFTSAPAGSATNPNVGHGAGDPSYSGIPNAQVAGLTSGQKAFLTTGGAGPSNVNDYAGYSVAGYGPGASIPGGTPIWLTKLAAGGYTRAPEFIAGDRPGGLGNAAELVVNPTHAPIQVLSHPEMMAMMARAKQETQPRYAGGTDPGVMGGGQDFGYARDNTYGAPPTLGAAYDNPAPGATGIATKAPMQAEGGNAGLGAPKPTSEGGAGFSGYGGSQPPTAPTMTTQPITAAPMAAPPASAPPVLGPPAAAGGMPVGNVAAAPLPAAAPAGQNPILNADGSYGMPALTPYQTYAPSVLANQPFYQKLIGNAPAPDFQGFGATLSNPTLGFNNVPSNINLQNFNQLSPSEQQQVQSLYSQGLGVDWNDIYARAKAAYAPFTQGTPTRWLTPSYQA